MEQRRYLLQRWLFISLLLIASGVVLGRLAMAISGLLQFQPDDFLSVPLAVILPFAAFVYLLRLPGAKSSEGAIMRLAALLLLIMIMSIPSFALHLALGFPVAFLGVELFETHFHATWRNAIKGRLLA